MLGIYRIYILENCPYLTSLKIQIFMYPFSQTKGIESNRRHDRELFQGPLLECGNFCKVIRRQERLLEVQQRLIIQLRGQLQDQSPDLEDMEARAKKR